MRKTFTQLEQSATYWQARAVVLELKTAIGKKLQEAIPIWPPSLLFFLFK